jgi:hypothetical protein
LWADANNWSGYKVPSQLNGAIFNAPATVTISKGDNTDWLQINSSGVQLVGANLSTASINIAGTATLGIGCQLTPIYGLAINGAIEILSGGGINLTNTAWRQSGNITVDAGGSLTYSSISSSMSMTGNLINNGGNVTFSAAGFLLTGNLYNNSGNLNVQNNAGIYPTTLYTITVTATIALATSQVPKQLTGLPPHQLSYIKPAFTLVVPDITANYSLGTYGGSLRYKSPRPPIAVLVCPVSRLASTP